MNSLSIGDIIAIAIILAIVFTVLVIILILVHDPVKDRFNYCHDCSYVSCNSEPKSKDCWKLQDESASNKTVVISTPWFHSIDVQAEVEKLANNNRH